MDTLDMFNYYEKDREKISWVLGHVFLLVFLIFMDYLIWHQPFFEGQYFWPLADNFTHGLVAFFIWLLAELRYSNLAFTFPGLFRSICCAGLSCAMDADHFILAKSFKLKDALNLQTRPILHSTLISVWVSLSVYYFLKIFRRTRVYSFWRPMGFIVFVAFISHNLRDSWRRGITLYPLEYSISVSYSMYLILTLCFPTLTFKVLKLVLSKNPAAYEFNEL